MSRRKDVAVAQVHRGRWLWAVEIPWLPDLLDAPQGSSLTGRPVLDAFGRQLAFLRALSAGARDRNGAALQLRFVANPEDEQLRCRLIGAADSEDDALLLARIVTSGLPPELPMEPIAAERVTDVLRVIDPASLAPHNVCEIRRGLDQLDPTRPNSSLDEQVLFAWSWSPQAMLATLGLLRQQPTVTQLVVHLEPDALPHDVAAFLQDEVARMLSDNRDDAAADEIKPLTRAAVATYVRWLRLLPKASFHLRLMLAAEEALVPGLAESLSTDLTRSFEDGREGIPTVADIVAPASPAELDACAALLDELRGVPWRSPRHPALARLIHTFDPLEAHVAFRFPVAPRGGLAGIASRKPTTLDQGVDVRLTRGVPVLLGTTASGDPFGLEERDLNQHVLVAGLPGFGKSSTVQLLLRRTYAALGVPFLVLDPAKGDYGPLMQGLRETGHDVGVYRLSPHEVAFNPLAVPPGVDPWVHAGRVIAAFDSALGLSAINPLAFVFLQRVIRILFDEVLAGEASPTMSDLYRRLGDAIRTAGFSPQTRSDLEGVLLARVELLAAQTTGRALMGGPNDAVPWATILRRPTLIELGAFAGPSERALMFALLIAGLVSYREAHPVDGGLAHLTVLEEAHRVLRGGNGQDSGVEVFVDAIAELRGAGEGFIVVDQTPSQLHPSVLKLTGTKLAHRLTDAEERAHVGASMVLGSGQLDDLGRLAPQRLVAYPATGSTSVLVDVDDASRPAANPERDTSLVDQPTESLLWCIGCPVMCTASEGAQHGTALLVDVEAGTVRPQDLFPAAHARTRSLPQAYCAAAWTATALYARRPVERGTLMRGIRATYFAQQRARRETSS